jgi:hypothetical protein
MESNGDFVVTWTSTVQDSSTDGVYAQKLEAPPTAAGEFQVNTHTTLGQSAPAVATDADGDFVVVWHSADQDGDGLGVYAQRYNAAGTAQGAEFLVNTYTTGNQVLPRVAMDNDGDFVVVWESYGQDGDHYGIYAQRFNSSGTAQGSEFAVNTATTSWQLWPDVAMDSDGDFVIVWFSQHSALEIYAQRYNSAGVAQGGNSRVDTTGGGLPAVAMDDDGDYVVTWSGNDPDLSGGIKAQRFNSSGVAQGSEFGVNTYTTGAQVSSRASMDADGDFVITWQSNGQDGSNYGIYAQRYNSAGTAQGGEFRVNTYTTGNQYDAEVAMDADGDFVVTWNSIQGGQWSILAQRYAASGAALGAEFQVSSDYAVNGNIAMDADGDFIVVWEGYDDDSTGIFAQRYA